MADDATPPHPTDAPTDVPTNAPADAPADEALGAFADRATTEVTRTVDLDADAGDVWRAVSDPDERALWLDDPDAVSRRIRVDEATPG